MISPEPEHQWGQAASPAAGTRRGRPWLSGGPGVLPSKAHLGARIGLAEDAGEQGRLLPSGTGVRVMLMGTSACSRAPRKGPSPGDTPGTPGPVLSLSPGRFLPNHNKRRYLLGPTRLFQEYLTLLVPPGNQTSGSGAPISQLWQPKLPLSLLICHRTAALRLGRIFI